MHENRKLYGSDAPLIIIARSSHPTTVSLFSLEKVKGVSERSMVRLSFSVMFPSLSKQIEANWFLTRMVVSCISKTSSLLEPRKALGGWKDESQCMSKEGLMEQVVLRVIMPKGYGTVKSPHLVGQPGLPMFEASLASVVGKNRGIRRKAIFR